LSLLDFYRLVQKKKGEKESSEHGSSELSDALKRKKKEGKEG